MNNYPSILSLPPDILAQILAGTTNCDQIMLWRVNRHFSETIKTYIRFIYNIMRSKNPYLMRIWPKSESELSAQREYDATIENVISYSDFERFFNACKLRVDLSLVELGPINLERVPERHTDPYSYTRAVYCAILIANPDYNEGIQVDKIKVQLAVYIFYVKNGITPDVAYYYARSEGGVGQFIKPRRRANPYPRSKEIAALPEVRTILDQMLNIPVLRPYDTPRVPLAAVRAVDIAVLKGEDVSHADWPIGETPLRIELAEAFVRLGPRYAERYMAREIETLEHPLDTVNDNDVWDATFNTPQRPEVVAWPADLDAEINLYNPKFTAEAILGKARQIAIPGQGQLWEYLGEEDDNPWQPEYE